MIDDDKEGVLDDLMAQLSSGLAFERCVQCCVCMCVHACMCVCVCVRTCVRACVCVHALNAVLKICTPFCLSSGEGERITRSKVSRFIVHTHSYFPAVICQRFDFGCHPQCHQSVMNICACFHVPDENKRPVMRKNESRSREDSNPALSPPRDADTATVKSANDPEQARGSQDAIRAVLTGSATGRQTVDNPASGGVNGTAPSQAEMLLSNLRKQGLSSAGTML